MVLFFAPPDHSMRTNIELRGGRGTLLLNSSVVARWFFFSHDTEQEFSCTCEITDTQLLVFIVLFPRLQHAGLAGHRVRVRASVGAWVIHCVYMHPPQDPAQFPRPAVESTGVSFSELTVAMATHLTLNEQDELRKWKVEGQTPLEIVQKRNLAHLLHMRLDAHIHGTGALPSAFLRLGV